MGSPGGVTGEERACYLTAILLYQFSPTKPRDRSPISMCRMAAPFADQHRKLAKKVRYRGTPPYGTRDSSGHNGNSGAGYLFYRHLALFRTLLRAQPNPPQTFGGQRPRWKTIARKLQRRSV